MVVTNWACIKCGVTNEKTSFKCQTCQEPKPIFWECSSCKVKNPTASLKCNGCKRKRPAIFGNTVHVSDKMPPATAGRAPNTAVLWPGAQGQPKSNQGPMPFPSSYSQQSKNNSTNSVCSTNQMTSVFNSTISGFSAGYSGASTISQVSGNHSTMSSLSQSVSSYDIFVKLNKPNRTVKQIVFNELEGEDKFRQALESCARTGGVYHDPKFKPSLYLLYFEPKVKRQDQSLPRIFWLRPGGMRPVEMAYDEKSPVQHGPWVVMREPVAGDITQGILGNCWLLSALVLLVEKPALLDKVLITREFIPQGVYHVRLYKDGRLTSVLVDDQLPCNNKRLLVYSSAKRKQLFVPIIEKAMSRLFGCYESLVAGQTCEGLSALTGFPCRSIRTLAMQRSELGNVGGGGGGGQQEGPSTLLEPDYIWAMLLSFQSAGFLMGAGCSCTADTRISEDEFLQRGLIPQHAYTVLNVVNLPGNIRLLQLRNPWGSQVWTGDWSDGSRTWNQAGALGATMRDQLHPWRASEGIFWISFTDFQRYFEKVDVCKIRTGWQELRFEGYFPCSCADLRYLSVFEVQVEEPSTELEITLHQESRRAVSLHKTPLLPICVSIYQLKDVQMKTCGDLVDFSGYKMREFLGCDVMLDKGVYLIAMYAFNHWSTSVTSSSSPSSKSSSQKGGQNIRPRFVMSCHSSRPVTINCHCPAATIPGDTLLELVTARGQRTQHDDYVYSYYLTDNWSGMVVVVENHHSSSYLEVIFDASESTNLHSTRGSLLTQDTIPPMSRQLVNVFSHLDPRTAYYLTHDMSYRVSGQAAGNHNPDLGTLVPLHSPRSIKK